MSQTCSLLTAPITIQTMLPELSDCVSKLRTFRQSFNDTGELPDGSDQYLDLKTGKVVKLQYQCRTLLTNNDKHTESTRDPRFESDLDTLKFLLEDLTKEASELYHQWNMQKLTTPQICTNTMNPSATIETDEEAECPMHLEPNLDEELDFEPEFPMRSLHSNFSPFTFPQIRHQERRWR